SHGFGHRKKNVLVSFKLSLVLTRPLARTWTLMLFLDTCLLFCARMVMPICTVSMASTFHWTKTESGLVLGGFFWGYCFTQILGGHVSDKVGGERVLFISTASWAVITAVTPLLAKVGNYPLALMTMSRFLMGLSQGVHYPSLASLCSQRIEEGERGFLMSIMHSGSNMGTLIVGGLGSLMLEWYGWESVFYGTGLLSGLWVLMAWQYFLKGTCIFIPKQRISSKDAQWSLSVWLSLLKKPPVCAMVIAHMCINSALYTVLSWLPTYFEDSFPHALGWVYNVIPWLVAIPSALGGGYVSDFLISQGYAVASVRKIMQFFAMGVSSMFLLLLCSPVKFTSALAYISAAVGFSGSCLFSVVLGVMNMCGAFMGLLLVSFSGYLIEVTLSWAMVFSVITLVNVTGLGFFVFFGDAHRVDLEVYSQYHIYYFYLFL
uniref:Solute carrier family 17 member 9 n=1 Tax=Myripristis murdjan TaxID=586833 RepID=A0A667WQ39_9TELE